MTQPTSPSEDGEKLHTPTPWRVKPGTAIIEQFKDGLWGLIVADCRMTDEGEANAAFIVEAVAALTRPAMSVDVRKISDEDMRELLSAKDVGSGRAKLKRILAALTRHAQSSPALDPVTVEACAKVMVKLAGGFGGKSDDYLNGFQAGCNAKSDAIRALIGQPAPTGDSK